MDWSNVAVRALGPSVPGFAIRAWRMGSACAIPAYGRRVAADRHMMAMLLRRRFQGIDKEVTELRQAFAPIRLDL